VRILSVGRPLPHPNIDNHSVFNAPAFSDFDAIAVDPGGLFETVREAADGRGDHRTFSDLRVINGTSATHPTAGDTIAIADVLRRRLDETARVLEGGGVVVVFAHAQSTLPDIVGFHGADRYCFLPAPPGIAWGPPMLRWGEGRTAGITDHAHPFSNYVEAIRDDIRYRAVFDEQAAGFSAAANVFARAGGGAPVGVEFAVRGGRVVFLPTPGERAPMMEQGQAVEAGVRNLMGRPDSGETAPYWLGEADVPGLAPLLEAAETARDIAHAADERAAAAAQEAQALARVRDVLWREGPHGLLPAVLRCCELVGFRPIGDERAPLLSGPEGDLLLEAEGSSDAVGMAPHYRLRARIDAAIARGDPPPRGLVVANGQRQAAPDRRDRQYIDALRVAAEATRYALLPAPLLFAAACAALAGAEAEKLAAVRRRLIETDGMVSLADVIGEG
jgi:hypothetical protein